MDKVLIVDDSEQLLDLLRRIQNDYKDEFELILVNSGTKAMAVLKEMPIDLVVTDLIMPQVDGLTLLTHINERYPDVLCIAMTGYATENVVRMPPDNLLQLLKKPFDVQNLIAVIRKGLKTEPAAGTMRGIAVASFLQLLELDQKSCALEVTLASGQQGSFFFKEGILYDATFGSLAGKEAAIAMISSGEKPRFTLKPAAEQDIPRRITCRLMELLLQAAQKKDESTATAPEPAG